ncbi:hypothetical protein [Phenylobacterium koreense]|uniref:DUF3421 domain-containing protein n=1 Tax=Phenylobacterium koreense TaxID=266125 RepID=A0ABV2EMZ1_9CAUL
MAEVEQMREGVGMKGYLLLGRIILAAGLAQVAAEALAQPADRAMEEPKIVLNVTANPSDCNLQSASRVKLESLTRGGEKWIGRCVKVDGVWSGRALFLNAGDLNRARYPQSDDKLGPRRVGLYLPDELLESAPAHGRSATAVGVVGDCETLSRGALMVMGYCHYTDGPYIAVSEMRK